MRKMASLGSTVVLVCDGWMDISKNHILGCILKVGDEWFLYNEALGRGNGNIMAGDRHDGVTNAEEIECAIERAEADFGFRIGCVTTDDAGQCARAKRILALHFPNMYFGRCYAHQVNLIVKDVLKASFLRTVQRAKDLVSAYQKCWSNWLVQLNMASKSLYGSSLALMRIVDVC